MRRMLSSKRSAGSQLTPALRNGRTQRTGSQSWADLQPPRRSFERAGDALALICLCTGSALTVTWVVSILVGAP